MSKVYFAEVDEDYGGVYIAGPNIKEAKKIARRHEICDNIDRYTDLKIRMCRKDGKPVRIDHLGELDIDQILSAGLAWWSCPNCDGNNFKTDGHPCNYICRDCGHTEEIPYLE